MAKCNIHNAKIFGTKCTYCELNRFYAHPYKCFCGRTDLEGGICDACYEVEDRLEKLVGPDED